MPIATAFLRRLHRDEKGQALVMMIMAMTLIFMIGVLVVDFGFWFSGRASVVNAADQATMSGSLKLPNDGAGATADAIAYLQANDPDVAVADIGVSFRCIAGDRDGNGVADSVDITVNCPQVLPSAFVGHCTSGICYAPCTFTGANAKCNTIVTSGSKSVPFGFGSAFGLASGNAAGFTSAACRGACGAAPTLPLDVVMIIDRTGSMSSTDLTHAKDGANAVLKLFDPNVQHVALGTLPRSVVGNDCQSVASNSAPGNWILTSLLGDYQNPDGSLNAASKIVTDINCLQTAVNYGLQTDLGDPLKAAADFLQANGRPGVKKGIIFLTDGEANVGPGQSGRVDTSTGQLFCTTQAFVTTNAGDNNGYEGNSSGTCADGGTSGTDTNSGTNTTSSPLPGTCTNNGKDMHVFSNFGAGPAIPASPAPTIDGIQVRLDAWTTSATGTRIVCAALSWDGGVTYTTAKSFTFSSSSSSTSEQTYLLGVNNDTWGQPWTLAQLSNANFRVRVTDISSSASTIFHLDAVATNVYYHYTDPSLVNLGPCDWAATQSNIARAAGIVVFTIGYGVAGSTCSNDAGSSPYDGAPATRLLAWMATGANPTADDGGDGPGGLPGGCPSSGPSYPAAINSENADGDNFLCEAKTAELIPVFTAAAEALASGSRLVKIPF